MRSRIFSLRKVILTWDLNSQYDLAKLERRGALGVSGKGKVHEDRKEREGKIYTYIFLRGDILYIFTFINFYIHTHIYIYIHIYIP